jgi:hypothetical protein
MNVQVRYLVAQEHVVDVARREGPADRARDMLNVPPVRRKFVRRQIAQVCDVPAPEDHRDMPVGNRSPFQESLAGTPSIEGPV